MQMTQVCSSPFTSSGGWDGCNYVSLKIVRVCLLEPERRSIALGAHGSAVEWLPEKNTGSIGEKKYGMMGEGRMNMGLEPSNYLLTWTTQWKALTPGKAISHFPDLLLVFPGFTLSWNINIWFNSSKLALLFMAASHQCLVTMQVTKLWWDCKVPGWRCCVALTRLDYYTFPGPPSQGEGPVMGLWSMCLMLLLTWLVWIITPSQSISSHLYFRSKQIKKNLKS